MRQGWARLRAIGATCALFAMAATSGSAQAQAIDGLRIALWANGAPGYEARAREPESSAEYWTRNIHNPSITAYVPDPARATGAAVILMPGGAHEFLVTTSEGADVARWFAARGIAAFVLRYRLFRAKDRPYSQDEARADADRAVRLIRHRAAEWQIDPKRIGLMGFSAGGELASWSTLSDPVASRGKPDAIDAVSARPDFAILVFPGPLAKTETVTKDSPPLLLAATNDDACCSQPILDLLTAYRKAGASAEMHMYPEGGHAFNMGEHSRFVALRRWPARITEWLVDRKLAPPSILDPGILPPELAAKSTP